MVISLVLYQIPNTVASYGKFSNHQYHHYHNDVLQTGFLMTEETVSQKPSLDSTTCSTYLVVCWWTPTQPVYTGLYWVWLVPLLIVNGLQLHWILAHYYPILVSHTIHSCCPCMSSSCCSRSRWRLQHYTATTVCTRLQTLLSSH